MNTIVKLTPPPDLQGEALRAFVSGKSLSGKNGQLSGGGDRMVFWMLRTGSQGYGLYFWDPLIEGPPEFKWSWSGCKNGASAGSAIGSAAGGWGGAIGGLLGCLIGGVSI